MVTQFYPKMGVKNRGFSKKVRRAPQRADAHTSCPQSSLQDSLYLLVLYHSLSKEEKNMPQENPKNPFLPLKQNQK